MSELEQYDPKEFLQQCLEDMDLLRPEALWGLLKYRPICSEALSALAEEPCRANTAAMFEFALNGKKRKALWLHGCTDTRKRCIVRIYPENRGYADWLPREGRCLELRSWYECSGVNPWESDDSENPLEIAAVFDRADPSPGRLPALLTRPFDPALRGHFPLIEAFIDRYRTKMEEAAADSQKSAAERLARLFAAAGMLNGVGTLLPYCYIPPRVLDGDARFEELLNQYYYKYQKEEENR